MKVVSHIDIRRPAADVVADVNDQTNGPEWQHGLARHASPLVAMSIRKEDSEDSARLEAILGRTSTTARGVRQ
jgi:hypothetical protein